MVKREMKMHEYEVVEEMGWEREICIRGERMPSTVTEGILSE